MDVRRFADVIAVLEGEQPEYDAALVGLVNAYTAARSNPAQDHTAAIEAAREAVSLVLKKSATNRFAPTQLEIMREIGAIDFFGVRAEPTLEQALRASMNGMSSVVASLEKFRSEIARVLSAGVQARNGLLVLHVVSASPTDSADFEIGVLIPAELVDSKLGALTKQLDEWNKALKAFAELAGEDEREITVKALATGSFVLIVKAGVKTAKLVADMIGAVVALYKRLVDLRDLRDRFAKTDVPAPEVEIVKKHEADTVDRSVADIVGQLMREASVEPGRQGELEVALTISVKKTIRFIDSGGAVEVTAPPMPQEGVAENEIGEEPPQAQPYRAAIAAVQTNGAAVATLPPRTRRIVELPRETSATPELDRGTRAINFEDDSETSN